MIFTGFAPNITKGSLALDMRFLLDPRLWREWNDGTSISRVEKQLQDFFSVPSAVTCDSGRSALMLALRALGVGEGSDVLVQAYTCVVVVNAIQFVGARPVFVDMQGDFFIDAKDAEKKITRETRAIVLQHTFGIPGHVGEIMSFARSREIAVIEDCAHSIAGQYDGKRLGTFGDAAIFSFGSDKVISCVRGGAAISRREDIGARLIALRNALPYPSNLRTFQHLIHDPLFFAGKKMYDKGIGKAFLAGIRRLRILEATVTEAEKRGVNVHEYPTRLSNALARVVESQMCDLPRMEAHRRAVADLYASEIKNSFVQLPRDERQNVSYTYLRYPIIVEKPKRLLQFAKKRGIILGDWYNAVVAPCENGCPHVPYSAGSCPSAEHAARGSVNLPTDISISLDDAKKIVRCVNQFCGV